MYYNLADMIPAYYYILPVYDTVNTCYIAPEYIVNAKIATTKDSPVLCIKI